MKKIGIISDTHSYWDEKYLHYFEPCDEIWHAGDIGSVEVAEKLAAFRPFRAVCGNCDSSARMSMCSSNISGVIQATTIIRYVRRCMPHHPSSSSLDIHIY